MHGQPRVVDVRAVVGDEDARRRAVRLRVDVLAEAAERRQQRRRAPASRSSAASCAAICADAELLAVGARLRRAPPAASAAARLAAAAAAARWPRAPAQRPSSRRPGNRAADSNHELALTSPSDTTSTRNVPATAFGRSFEPGGLRLVVGDREIDRVRRPDRAPSSARRGRSSASGRPSAPTANPRARP